MKKDWTEVLKQKVDAYVPDDMQLPGFEDLKQKMLAAGAARSASEGASAGSSPKGAAVPLKRNGLRYLAYAASLAAIVAGGALLLRNGGSKASDGIADAGITVASENTSVMPVGQESVTVIEPTGADALAAADINSVPAPSAVNDRARRTVATNDASAVAADDARVIVQDKEESDGKVAESEADSGNADADADASVDADANLGKADDSGNYASRDIYSPRSSEDPFQEPVKPINKQLKRFSIGASGLLASNNQASRNSAPDRSALEVTTDKFGNKYYSMGAPELQFHYTAPVSGGLSLRYQLTNQFYAETGLRFTYLRTSVTPSGAQQNLLYLGIPLGVGCKFVQLGDFDLYGSAYGMVSKCIVGSKSTNFPSNYTKLDEIPLLLSASVAPGAEYHFNSYLGLYMEPTLSYYFKNESAPQTLYKENPFYFTLNLGLRFNL